MTNHWFSSVPLRAGSALMCGLALPFSFAPFNYWFVAILSPIALALLLDKSSRKTIFWISFAFGLGLFGSGVSWVYISIHDFGFTGVPLAVVLTSLFVIFLAFVFAVPFVVFARIFQTQPYWLAALFPCVWVFGEWLRSWLFSGFPWLYLGYAYLDTYLAGWAPLGGVFSISFLSILSGLLGVASMQTLRQRHADTTQKMNAVKKACMSLGFALFIWLTPSYLSNISWTKVEGELQSVAILQPNIELYKKWNPIYFSDIFSALYTLSDQHWDKDIQIWPEAAIPSVFNNVRLFTNDIDEKAKNTHTNVFSGILYDRSEPDEVYNSIIGLGLGSGTYFKQKLVPFGEYVPFEDQLRGLIQFFDLPNSVIRRGPLRKNALSATTNMGQTYLVAPLICYEVVYPDFVARNAADAELLLTISNDAWFGKSSGPLQHFEMVRMRALENQKYMLRATNTGVSGIIDDKGHVLVLSEQFIDTTIEGYVELRSGSTPFSTLGSYPILLLIFALLGTFYFRSGHNLVAKITSKLRRL